MLRLTYTKKAILVFILLALASPSVFGQEKQFKLGLISDKPVGRIKEYAPLAEYAAKRLKKFGITSGKIVVVKNVDQMFDKIRKKEVDVVFESAFPTIEMMKEASMRPSLLAWKKGSSEYTSVIFVKKESPIRQLNDLRGKTIVFEDPKSTSAYLLPKVDIGRAGLPVLPMNERGKDTASVHYVFAGEETNQAFWVIQEKADAGAFSSDDWNELAEGVRRDLRIIHETKPVLRFIVSFHPAMSVELSNAVLSTFMEMDDDPEGSKVLAKAAGIQKIEALSHSDRQSLRYVEELMSALE